MNINQLKYFVAVAEYQSFTKAANQYYISQTAITQQIHALETQMDVCLIDRTKRPVALTSAGNVFLSEAKAILERINSAMNKVHDASIGLVGTLRIGYTKGYEKSNLSFFPRIQSVKFFQNLQVDLPSGLSDPQPADQCQQQKDQKDKGKNAQTEKKAGDHCRKKEYNHRPVNQKA